MKLKIDVEVSFSSDEDSDLFIFVKSDFNDEEIDYCGITFEQIAEKSCDLLESTGFDETITMKQKIESAIDRFLKNLDDMVSKQVADYFINRIEKSENITDLDKETARLAIHKMHRLKANGWKPVMFFGTDVKPLRTPFSSLFVWEDTPEGEDFWKMIYRAIGD